MNDEGYEAKRLKLAKKLRLAFGIEDDPNAMEVAGPSNGQPSTPAQIFKLNVHCCEEIFEYLSLEELHAFGHTCKALNKVTAEYIERNYSVQYVKINDLMSRVNNAGFTNLPGFNDYVTKLECSAVGTSQYLTHEADVFTPMKCLRCVYSNLRTSEIIQNILPKNAVLEFRDIFTVLSVYAAENVPEMCPKQLSGVELSYGRERGPKWLQEIYPNLTQLNCHHITESHWQMDELKVFFARNPSVRSFSIKFTHLWENRESFLGSSIKLDLLAVDNVCKLTFESIELFKQLYERGFYQRLHLVLKHVNQYWSDELLTLQPLEKLTVYDIYNWPPLLQLRRLDLVSPYLYTNRIEFLANRSTNLERVSILHGSFDIILTFVRQSVHLKKLRVSMKGQDKFLNLAMLNKERAKLAGARNVTIYVEDDVYLATKWAIKNGDTNFSLVEMRRYGSIEWDDL